MVKHITPKTVMQETFGFSAFRDGQEAVVDRLLAGRSVLAIFPTGAGKSLTYQLPALMLDGLTVVISPLIALMKDQIDFLRGKGVAAARLDSTLEFEESRQVLSDLNAGKLKLLYIAPERLASERFLQTLSRLKIDMLAVDEAHCISEWGHNFRPDYLKLAELARKLKVGRVLGLTATATPAVAEDIAKSFGIATGDIVKTPFHRKNLVLRVTPTGSGDRDRLLLERIQSRPRGPTIVYVTLQKTAEEVAAYLSRAGLAARAYHAGLKAEDRHTVQDWFMASSDAIVVATIAFGMGIDKSNIRAVYHYNLPKSLENYAQEIGRAGRDGKESVCEMLACARDRTVLENFTYGDTPATRSLALMLKEVLELGEMFDVSIYDLSGRHDIRPLVVETVLTYLELDGIITSTGPFYNEYKFQTLRPIAEVTAKFDAQRRQFLETLFKSAEMGRSWMKLDIAVAMQVTGAPRGRIVTAMNYLEEQGDLKLEVAGAQQGYRRLRHDVDLRALAEKIAGQFAERERRDVERIGRVLEFAGQEACRTAALLAYFGEPLKGACGHCDVCMRESSGSLATLTTRRLGDVEMKLIRDLKAERKPALATPRPMARFLCGITSPALTRAKLKDDRRFGALEKIPFAEVLKAVSEA